MEPAISTNRTSTLAIHGGERIRKKPMPARRAISESEEHMLLEALAFYKDKGVDPGYQGQYEERYCEMFVDTQGGGFADAVATGTAALYVALAALNLPKGSEVLVSPITDPGTLSAIILNGLVPKLVDSKRDSFNTGPEQIAARIDAKTTCALIVHAAGQATEIDAIVSLCHQHGVKVLEDCSQAHGASWKGKKVGTFGDIAAFSTMYRKASITGPCGGVVYTTDEALYHQALAHADRGKPRWLENFDDRNPNEFLFPALNLHLGELSCAIGIASFSRLSDTIKRRLAWVRDITYELNGKSKVCIPYGFSEEDSPFYYPIFVDKSKIHGSKIDFANAVRAEGIDLNPHYQYLIQEWQWVKPYLADDFDCINARLARDRAFCLYVNENYGTEEVSDTVEAVLKVERALTPILAETKARVEL